MEISFIKQLTFVKSLTFSVIMLASTYASAFWGYDPSLTKTIETGSIQGTEDNYDTHAFKGIPYAAPPVGNLRWRAPQDVESWEGVRDTSEFGSICAQKGTFWGTDKPEEFNTAIGSEDCLFLNVWRPNNHRKHLPVLLWIHGGSHTRGSSSFDIYNGAHLANEANAIIVSINYRLGALGWMHNTFADNGDPEDASGNYALLDMIKSLNWVQDNIREFGGNPNKVTIAGNSSACKSVWGILHSPLAEDLFHRAICSSGFPDSTPAELGQQISDSYVEYVIISSGLATDLESARAVRTTQGEEWVAALMRSVPAEVFSLGITGVPSYFIDGYVLPELSEGSVTAGAYNKVPLMIGSTKNESSYFLGALAGFFNAKGGASDPILWNQLNADPTTISPADIIDPATYPIYVSVEKGFSYAWNLATDKTVSNARQNNHRVYRYDMNWDDVPAPWNEVFGTQHSLDLAFLFGNFITDKDNIHRYAWTEDNKAGREELSENLMKYVSRFMRTGNPNAGWGLPFWPRWKNTNHTHLGTRILLDETIDHSSNKFKFEEYQALLDTFTPEAKAATELWVQRFGLQLED